MPTIAIIGSGIGGLYAAYSLSKASSADICIFESNSHVGGRLLTESGYDLGAGRFCPSYHPLLFELVRKFNISISPFDYETGYSLLTSKDYSEHYHKVLNHQTCENPNRINFKEECLKFLNKNAFNDLCTHSGYDTLHSRFLPFSLGKSILSSHPESFLKSSDKKWFYLLKGFQELPKKIYNYLSFEKFSLHLCHSLINMSKKGKKYVLHFLNKEKKIEKTVDNVVLAMTPLQLATSQFEFQKKNELTKNLVGVPLFKCFLHYKFNWWKDLDFSKKCMILDNPLRKLYFQDDTNTIFFYVDGKSALFWKETLAKGENVFLHTINSFISSSLRLKNKIEEPQRFTHKFWEQGIFFWRFGYKYAEQYPQFLQISPEIYLCSDILTPYSGWIEGSLISAKSIVQKIPF